MPGAFLASSWPVSFPMASLAETEEGAFSHVRATYLSPSLILTSFAPESHSCAEGGETCNFRLLANIHYSLNSEIGNSDIELLSQRGDPPADWLLKHGSWAWVWERAVCTNMSPPRASAVAPFTLWSTHSRTQNPCARGFELAAPCSSWHFYRGTMRAFKLGGYSTLNVKLSNKQTRSYRKPSGWARIGKRSRILCYN